MNDAIAHRVSIAAAAAMILLAWPQIARAQTCSPPTPPPRVEFTFDSGTVKYDFTQSRQDLARLRREAGVVGATSEQHPLGLTLSRLETAIGIESSIQPVRDGFCSYLTVARIKIGYPSLAVYVDKRYAKDSCQHKAILDHENEHVRIHREALHRNEATIQKEMNVAAKKSAAMFVTDKAKAGDAHAKALREAMATILARIERYRNEKDGKHDSAASRQQTTQRCTKW